MLGNCTLPIAASAGESRRKTQERRSRRSRRFAPGQTPLARVQAFRLFPSSAIALDCRHVSQHDAEEFRFTGRKRAFVASRANGLLERFAYALAFGRRPVLVHLPDGNPKRARIRSIRAARKSRRRGARNRVPPPRPHDRRRSERLRTQRSRAEPRVPHPPHSSLGRAPRAKRRDTVRQIAGLRCRLRPRRRARAKRWQGWSGQALHQGCLPTAAALRFVRDRTDAAKGRAPGSPSCVIRRARRIAVGCRGAAAVSDPRRERWAQAIREPAVSPRAAFRTSAAASSEGAERASAPLSSESKASARRAADVLAVFTARRA